MRTVTPSRRAADRFSSEAGNEVRESLPRFVGGLAVVGLGLATFAGRLEPTTRIEQGLPGGPAGHAESPPERPRATVDTAEKRPTAHTVPVPAGGDLQAALINARPGDVIALEPGATYRGPC